MATTPSRRRLDSGSNEPLLPHIPQEQQESPDSKKRNRRRSLSQEIQKCPSRIPCLSRLPRRLRLFLIGMWLIWKISITFIFFRLLWAGASSSSAWALIHHGASSGRPSTALVTHKTRVLYIVTALAEYNNGRRETKRGQDRLGEVLVPVLVDSVNSLVSHDYDVDVYLILGYNLKPERRRMIAERLPGGVGLDVWDEATPLGYPDNKKPKLMELNTRALSRQHRFVIKDKLFHYDLFMAWEDDIRITGDHVDHFLSMSAELKRLHEQAPLQVQDVPEDMYPKRMKFYGDMTKRQMQRLIPGFVRVEVLLDNGETAQMLDAIESPLPLDHEFGGEMEARFDPTVCCHVPDMQPNEGIPERPSLKDVVVWETNITALSLRHLPNSEMLDWVVLLPGPGKMLKPQDLIGGYWSGRDGAFGDDYDKPSPGVGQLMAQQGGWMATREQIVHLHTEQCHGSFLPPYDLPAFPGDGHVMKNVEFWSGGYQFFTGVRGGCNMQRLISFRPNDFSKHFIYHTANNKQKQLSKSRLVRADDLYGQLNSVRKAAERAKADDTVKK